MVSTPETLIAASRYLNEKELAVMLGVSVRTLQGWRLRRKGPPFRRLCGDAIRYQVDEVEAWFAAQPGMTPEAAA